MREKCKNGSNCTKDYTACFNLKKLLPLRYTYLDQLALMVYTSSSSELLKTLEDLAKQWLLDFYNHILLKTSRGNDI